MEMMLTGDSISGLEAAALGWATRAFPVADLEERVLALAERVAQLPPDIAQLNKRVVHRQMEMMGLRTAMRVGTELCALGTHQKSFQEFVANMRGGLTRALSERDKAFGDYRESERERKTRG
jgi:enoyl-CoA hydratase